MLAKIRQVYPQAAKDGAIGQPSPFDGGPYKTMDGWSDGSGTSCTFTCPKVMFAASGGASIPAAYDIAPAPPYTDPKGKKHPANAGHPAWIPYDEGRMPSIGDIYILTGPSRDKQYGAFLHVGIICHIDVSGDDAIWVTADGGQMEVYKNGQAAHLVQRKFRCMTQMPDKPKAPHFSGGAEGKFRRIHGWLDIGDPRVVFNKGALDDATIDQLYQDVGAWIDRARTGSANGY
jgi:hypothetical protein